MKYRVRHLTSYSGDQPVSICMNEVRLEPRVSPRQRHRAYELIVEPSPSWRSSRLDYFGNPVTMLSFYQGYDIMEVESRFEVAIAARPAIVVDQSAPWEVIRDSIAAHLDADRLAAFEFTFDSPRVRVTPDVADYARQSFLPGRPLLAAVAELTSRIHGEFEYCTQSSTVTTTVEEVLRIRRGVCQDFAQLEIAALRAMGLAARYVSGYLRTFPPPGKPRLIGADASHAWLAVYAGPLGWIDVDPTNNCFPDQDHVTVAWGRDYGDVCPLNGVYLGGGKLSLRVSVDLALIDEKSP